MKLRSILGAAGSLAASRPGLRPRQHSRKASTTDGVRCHGRDAPYDVLVFSKTAGFRHSSIPTGIAAVQELGAEHGFTVTATEDPDHVQRRRPRRVRGRALALDHR